MKMLLLLSLFCYLLAPSAHGSNFEGGTCEEEMQSWIAEQQLLFPDDRNVDKSKLLYFLHVPRTAGRTSHSCMLRPGTAPSRRCAKSYDGFKYNISVPNCGLFASHDDFSAMRFLPKESAVITSIRNPVDRFLSAYEFAVELGARSVVTRTQTVGRADRTSTGDVWPWKYLQPFFTDDISSKKEARRARAGAFTMLPFGDIHVKGVWTRKLDGKGRTYYWNTQTRQSVWTLPEGEVAIEDAAAIDAYDNDVIMPLREFAEHPIAQELLHNGQLLQVLGLTNYSHDPAAPRLRSCIWSDEATQYLALEYAKSRLRGMLHVGVYERLHLSLSTLATAVDMSLEGPSWRGDMVHAFSYDVSDDEDEHHNKENQDPNFLDRELPQTVHEITEMMRKVRSSLDASYKNVQDMIERQERGELTAEEEKQMHMLSAEVDEQRSLVTKLQMQLTNLRAGEKIVHMNEATGHARQLIADDQFLINSTVGQNFATCEAKAVSKSRTKRERILSRLTTQGGTSVKFSKAARARIPPEVLEEIETLNWMDMELHNLAVSLHRSTLEQQKMDGTFQDLEAYTKPHPPDEEVRDEL